MRHVFIASVVCAVIVASPAVALIGGSGGGDCESSSNGCGGGGPPVKPSLPGTSGKAGDYGVFITTNGDYRQGYTLGDMTTYFGGGPYQPIGGDGTLNVGIQQSHVTIKGDLTPEAKAYAAASAAEHYAAQGGMRVGYLVELHAKSAAAFAALQPLLNISGAVAHINGSYTLTQAGQSFSQAYAQTGTSLPLAPSLQASTGSICDRTGYHSSDGAGCGTFGYALDLNFAPGSAFTNGNRRSVYGMIDLGVATHAGRTGIDGVAGESTAFIDPTITLSGALAPGLYILNTGSAIVPGAMGTVPEPAAWALMLGGFGVVGGMARRRRVNVLA